MSDLQNAEIIFKKDDVVNQRRRCTRVLMECVELTRLASFLKFAHLSLENIHKLLSAFLTFAQLINIFFLFSLDDIDKKTENRLEKHVSKE